MQQPESQSTPKSRVKPLKTKDEFSSLHKRTKPLKDPLPVPDTKSSIARKPQISGGTRIFSTMDGTSSKKSLKKKPKHKSKMPLTGSREFKCRVPHHHEEVTLRVASNKVFIGSKSATSEEITLEYGILDDRKWYRYTAKKSGSPWEQFDLRCEDHVPFKNECYLWGFKLLNTGQNIPPIGRRIEPLEPPTRISRQSIELVVKLLECSSSSGPDSIGRLVEASINERGIYFTSTPFKFFKWNETSFEKADKTESEGANRVIKMASPKTFVLIDTMSSDNMEILDREIKLRSTASSKPHDSDPFKSELRGATLTESAKPTEQKEPQNILNSKKHEEISSGFGALDPAQFYSPQNTKSSENHGTKRPASASSPKSFRNDGLHSSPVRSVESIRKLSAGPSIPSSPFTGIFSPKVTPRKAKPTNKPSEHSDPPQTESSQPFCPSSPPGPQGVASEQQAESESDPKHQTHNPETTERTFKSPGRRPRRTRANVVDVDEDLETLVEPTEEDFSLLRSEGFKRVLYRFWDGKSMNVGIEDIARLNPQIYVNDTIIWFFLKLFMEQLVERDPDLSSQILMLDTFFYFSMRTGDTPPSWVAKMPIAQKHVIVMPIHERAHWSVAVIIGLDRVFQEPSSENANSSETYKPTVVVLDSLGPTQVHHTVRKVVTVLANSLKMQNRKALGLSDFRSMRANVPKQTNLTDCGVYLLHYIEQILVNPREFLGKVAATEGRVLDMGLEFWKQDELWCKRDSFKQKLKQMGNVPDETCAGNTNGSHKEPRSSSASSTSGSDPDEKAKQGRRLFENGDNNNHDNEDNNNENHVGNNAHEDDDDVVEVIGMETVTKKKRRLDKKSEASFSEMQADSRNSKPNSENTSSEDATKTQGRQGSSRVVDLS